MQTLKIAVIPGDGIGEEVIPEGIRALEAAGRAFSVQFEWTGFDWSVLREVTALTRDMGGKADTRQLGDAVLERIGG